MSTFEAAYRMWLSARNEEPRQLSRDAFATGFQAGLSSYAWWKDGHLEVGSCGTTLKSALKAMGTP